MALTKVNPRMIDERVIDVKSRGAGHGGANDATIIQAAINELSAAGGGTVYFPTGTYNVQTQLTPKSNVHYRGEGKNSLLKVNATPGPTYIFNATSAIDNVIWDGIGFDGSLNYPADSTVYKQTYANNNNGIRTAGVAATNVTIRNCYFGSLSLGAIDFNGEGTEKVSIINNYFYKASYVYKVISFRTPSGSPPAAEVDRPGMIVVTGNRIEIGGPQYHYDPSLEDWVASADGIDFDSCRDVTCSDNVISDIGGNGIRVEQTIRASVANNKVYNVGQFGINFYLSCFTCTCIGNTVYGYGKIPSAYAIRNYGGTYVVAREFPNVSTAPLPADPTVSTWFDTWPYTLDNIDTTKIIAYSDTDYYSGPSNGILPWRGCAGIGGIGNSTRVHVIGNTVIANDAVDGTGADLYSHEWGYSIVHPVNSVFAGGGANCVFIGNSSVNQSAYRFYHPQYEDPVNANGLLGTAIYVGNVDDSSLIYTGTPGVSDGSLRIGASGDQFMRAGVNVSQYLRIKDGVTAPGAATGAANIYVDTADGDLKVVFSDGTVKTIVTDT